MVRALVAAADKSTQFPPGVDELVNARYQRIVFPRRPASSADPILARLENLREAIKQARETVERARSWAKVTSPGTGEYKKWRRVWEQEFKRLNRLQDDFWELNLPDEEERRGARQREELRYQEWLANRRQHQERQAAERGERISKAPTYQEFKVKYPAFEPRTLPLLISYFL